MTATTPGLCPNRVRTSRRNRGTPETRFPVSIRVSAPQAPPRIICASCWATLPRVMGGRRAVGRHGDWPTPPRRAGGKAACLAAPDRVAPQPPGGGRWLGGFASPPRTELPRGLHERKPVGSTLQPPATVRLAFQLPVTSRRTGQNHPDCTALLPPRPFLPPSRQKHQIGVTCPSCRRGWCLPATGRTIEEDISL